MQKFSVFVFCVEANIYLLLYSLHDCTFNSNVVFRDAVEKKCKIRGNNFIKIPQTAAHHGWTAKQTSISRTSRTAISSF